MAQVMADEEIMADEEKSRRPKNRETPLRQGEATSSEPGTPSRREFLKRTTAGLLVGALAGEHVVLGEGAAPAAFRSNWPADVERVWIGPEYWSNPLQDWRLSDGRLKMVGSGTGRNVQLLTRRLTDRQARLAMRAQLGFYDRSGSGRAGFLLGAQGPVDDYRSDAVYGKGLRAGLTSEGQLFIGDSQRALSGEVGRKRGAALALTAEPQGSNYTLTLSAHHLETGEPLGQVQRSGLKPGQLTGNVALLAGFEAADEAGWGTPRVWFSDWQVEGDKVEPHPGRTFGPILFAQHTLSRGTMKMTVQLPPVGDASDQEVRLQTKQDGDPWQTIAEEPVDKLSRTATFRVEGWNDARDVPYRLAYRYQTAEGLQPHYYEGTVRHDPTEKDELVVGGLSCEFGTGFPHPHVVEGLRYHDPDLLAFTGDQYYENSGGFGVQRSQGNLEQATLDVLRKWYMHGWSFGDLMQNRPAICMPDDHDVYQGNIWGEKGKHVDTYKRHRRGGYFMPADWVNAVQRMQTSHLPDPYDPTPVRNGITVYYTDLLYGRISFAILEDRKWKSGPLNLIPPNPGRVDHIKDPSYDPSRLDVPEAELLGKRQLDFLESWAADWQGTDMKAVVSQSALAQVPTHHGPDYMYLVADLDSNGWPQTPRDEALRRFRKGFAFHLGGDQHLPMILRYGIDDWDDAGYNFSVPAIATGYPRAFLPEEAPSEARSRFHPLTEKLSPAGRYTDGLANKVTVHAVANPQREHREDVPEYLADKSSGYGILRFHKPSREITMEAWPILSDPAGGAEEQYAGWPQTAGMEENYGREAEAYLPTLHVNGATEPVVQVVDESHGEVVYTLRIQGRTFQPKVFREEGGYTVRVGDGKSWQKAVESVEPTGGEQRDVIEVRL